MADTAESTMADIQALLAQRGVSPNSAENLNRAMLMLRGGPDNGFINDMVSAAADGIPRAGGTAQPRRTQPGTRSVPQPAPTSQDTAGGATGRGSGAAGGTAASTASPAVAVTEPALPLNLTGENGEQQDRGPGTTGGQSGLDASGNASPDLIAQLEGGDQPLPYTMSPFDYMSGAAMAGGNALRNVAPSLIGSLARANMRPRVSVQAGSRPSTGSLAPEPMVAPASPATAAPGPASASPSLPMPPMTPMPRNSVVPVGPRGPQTNVEYPAQPRPVQIRMPEGGPTPGPIQPQSNPIQYTPGRPVAPDLVDDGGSALSRMLRNEAPPSPGTIPAAPARPVGTQPAPVAAPGPAVPSTGRPIPINNAPPPRSGPSPANVAAQTARQEGEVEDALRTGANARSRMYARNAVREETRSPAPGRQPARRGYGARRGDD